MNQELKTLILQMYLDGASIQNVTEHFGIKKSTLKSIVINHSPLAWKEDVIPRNLRRIIQQRYRDGVSLLELSDDYGILYETLYDFVV
jgi:uncharacterized protein (DUF433 family)